MAKKWIQQAIKRPGYLTAKAKSAGMSITEYCARSDLSTADKRRCALAMTLRRLAKRRKGR